MFNFLFGMLSRRDVYKEHALRCQEGWHASEAKVREQAKAMKILARERREVRDKVAFEKRKTTFLLAATIALTKGRAIAVHCKAWSTADRTTSDWPADPPKLDEVVSSFDALLETIHRIGETYVVESWHEVDAPPLDWAALDRSIPTNAATH